MAIIVEVKKASSESNSSLVRRFARRIKQSGFLQKVKKSRYLERVKSDFKQQQDAIKRIAKRQLIRQLWKQGKLGEIDPPRPLGSEANAVNRK